ncbi:hypothetical protein M9196_13065 [Vibrio sp. S4B1]|nr:hypothetical protein [Vibrio methylphosphonaticus]MCL9775654.1 hypothetical protein [Vibrio methylphosphonaticus]
MLAHTTSRWPIPPPQNWKYVPAGFSPWIQDEYQELRESHLFTSHRFLSDCGL